MDSFFRLLVRLILVPLGYVAAVAAGAAVILIGEWRIGTLFQPAPPDAAALGFFVAIVAAVFVVISLLSVMWLVAAVGILFSELFAVRSWMFHVANGAVSAWIGAELFSRHADAPQVVSDPFYVVAAGLAGGLAYWLVAGSSAGFFKPVLRSAAERAKRLAPYPPPETLPESPPSSAVAGPDTAAPANPPRDGA